MWITKHTNVVRAEKKVEEEDIGGGTKTQKLVGVFRGGVKNNGVNYVGVGNTR